MSLANTNLKNGPTHTSLFFVLYQQVYRKIVDFSGIRTANVRVEGKYADHHHGPAINNICGSCVQQI